MEAPVVLQRMAHEVQFPGCLKVSCCKWCVCAAILMRLGPSSEDSRTLHLIRFLTALRSFAQENVQPVPSTCVYRISNIQHQLLVA